MKRIARLRTLFPYTTLFRSHHDRSRAAPGDQQQVALDPARVEVRIQTAHDEHGVDVGRDQLLLVMLAGRAALDRAVPRQQRNDPRFSRRFAFHQHPVADRRTLIWWRLRTLPLGQRFGRIARIGRFGDDVTRAVLFHDPSDARGGMHRNHRPPLRILRLIGVGPADGAQRCHGMLRIWDVPRRAWRSTPLAGAFAPRAAGHILARAADRPVIAANRIATRPRTPWTRTPATTRTGDRLRDAGS